MWQSSARRVPTGGLNPYSWLSLPPRCGFRAWAASLADGKASGTLLGSASRAQVFSDKDLGLGFSPVGYRQQIHALLILPLPKHPARRISSQPNWLSKGPRRQQAECAAWQGPALRFSLSQGLRSRVAVVKLRRGGWQQTRLVETHALSLLRCMSCFLHGYCSVNWVGLFIF